MSRYRWAFILPLTFLLLSACGSAPIEQPSLNVTIHVDGQTRLLDLPAGSTVQQALEKANITLGSLDRVNPPVYSVLSDGIEIRVVRVREEYITRVEVLPFPSYTLPNESLPAEERRLIQAGQNGEQQVTTRIVYEDGVKVSEVDLEPVILRKPVEEIIMVGVQNPFAVLPIPGRLAYLSSGNAWLMEGSTANRRPIVTSGDLDGRVFSLSPDGAWLLYTRKSDRPAEQEINTLWVVRVEATPQIPVNLRVANIIHFADWRPGEKYTIAYSTVEPRLTAPGWQANNNLFLVSLDPQKSEAGKPKEVLPTSSGGIYGWWGTTFAWSPDGTQLAYTRPDSIGLVDLENGRLMPMVDILPLNTYGDWAWAPGLAWSPTGLFLYFVNHVPGESPTRPEESPFFELQAFSLVGRLAISLAKQSGMFAYPVPSPARLENGELTYRLAYLQAIFPLQSATSRYRLVVMDRDGSEATTLFPESTQPGLRPQTPVWSPDPAYNWLAVIYEGNLWLVNADTGQAYQVTGDSLVSRLDWK
ncbi:MAG: G5 domain-containing protein [Anaerolineales bacterium]|nr:G5 domain-containing protein [Anaerolineales bacterium]MDW8226716.1 G5 domain-containing protein [Anaerolineales bacterium]